MRVLKSKLLCDIRLVSPHFSAAFVAKRCSWLWLSRTQSFGCGTTKDPAGISPVRQLADSRQAKCNAAAEGR